MKVVHLTGRKIIAGISILLLLGLSAGCSQAEKQSWERFKEAQYKMVTGRTLDKQKTAKTEGQAAPADKQTGDVQGTVGSEPSQSKVTVNLYFAEQNGDYLKVEKREIAMVPGLAKATMQELISGPKTKGLTATMPEGTKLKDINVSDGLCTVDLSGELRDNHWGGSSGELLTVYSMVNTLTQFPSIQKVEILVDGQKIDTLTGHMDLSSPVTANTEIVK